MADGRRPLGGDDDDGPTRQTALPPTSPDDQPTGHVADVGVVAELRAVLSNGERKSLPLYTLADSLVVGRGTACEWQLDDASLSRKHAQLKWNGHELTVEDLGSANGTRVGGRPARTAIAVKPGEPIQLGTVVVTLEPRQAGGGPDDVATRMVATPESREEPAADWKGAPSERPRESFPNLPGLATVVKPPQMARPQAQPFPQPAPSGEPHKQVFHPSRDAARPDEPTRPWDPRAALYHPPDKPFDGELTERLKDAWKTNRRPFVLAGAALWIAMLLTVWWIHDRMQPEDDTPAVPHVPAPRVTSLAPPELPAALPLDAGSPLSDEERGSVLAEAVAAYEQGRLPEALIEFRKLAADPRDAAARFMVDLIQARITQAGAP